jgi:hypothetical protein
MHRSRGKSPRFGAEAVRVCKCVCLFCVAAKRSPSQLSRYEPLYVRARRAQSNAELLLARADLDAARENIKFEQEQHALYRQNTEKKVEMIVFNRLLPNKFVVTDRLVFSCSFLALAFRLQMKEVRERAMEEKSFLAERVHQYVVELCECVVALFFHRLSNCYFRSIATISATDAHAQCTCGNRGGAARGQFVSNFDELPRGEQAPDARARQKAISGDAANLVSTHSEN